MANKAFALKNVLIITDKPGHNYKKEAAYILDFFYKNFFKNETKNFEIQTAIPKNDLLYSSKLPVARPIQIAEEIPDDALEREIVEPSAPPLINEREIVEPSAPPLINEREIEDVDKKALEREVVEPSAPMLVPFEANIKLIDNRFDNYFNFYEIYFDKKPKFDDLFSNYINTLNTFNTEYPEFPDKFDLIIFYKINNTSEVNTLKHSYVKNIHNKLNDGGKVVFTVKMKEPFKKTDDQRYENGEYIEITNYEPSLKTLFTVQSTLTVTIRQLLKLYFGSEFYPLGSSERKYIHTWEYFFSLNKANSKTFGMELYYYEQKDIIGGKRKSKIRKDKGKRTHRKNKKHNKKYSKKYCHKKRQSKKIRK
jgi:hypothetical protein